MNTFVNVSILKLICDLIPVVQYLWHNFGRDKKMYAYVENWFTNWFNQNQQTFFFKKNLSIKTEFCSLINPKREALTPASVNSLTSFASLSATVNSTEVRRLGCITRNLCSLQLALEILLGPQANVVCGAPWATTISSVLLILALAMQKFLV